MTTETTETKTVKNSLLRNLLVNKTLYFNNIFKCQYILLHKTTNSMFIANKEIIKSTNGDLYGYS